MRLRKSFVAPLVAVSLVACQSGTDGYGYGGSSGGLNTPLGGTGATVGTLGGAAAGGLLGSQFGSGTGNVLATIAGTLAGGYLGNRLGQRFDERSRNEAALAERRALVSNQPTAWSNPSANTSGEVRPVRTFVNQSGQECREYVHSINVQGQQETGTGVACRQPDGSWGLVGSG